MKIKYNASKRKWYILLATLVAVAIGGLAFYFFVINPNQSILQMDEAGNKTTKINKKESPLGEVNYGSPSKNEENPTLDPQQEPSNHKSPSSPIGVIISHAGGSPLQIRVLIQEILSEGTCRLSLRKTTDSNPITQTVEVFPSASSATCRGFTIDTATMQKGNYVINITVTSGSRTGTVSQEIEI